MLTHALPYCPDPTLLFQHLLDQHWPILLDSMGLGRYDIISANPSQTYTEVAWDDLAIQLRADISSLDCDLPFCGGAMGYLGYDAGFDDKPITRTIDRELHMPDMAIGLYEWAIITDHKSLTTTYVHKFNDEKHWYWLQTQLQTPITLDEFSTSEPLTADQYQHDYLLAFDRIKQYIADGDCYQVNLTQRFSAGFNGDCFRLYQQLRKHNPAPFGGFFRLEQHDILSCSPERFIKIMADNVETKPIKGTRPRHSNNVKDLELANELLNSEKDRAENLMIVDLLRNDLSRSCVAGSVKTPKLFDLESYRSVHHLVSTVTGKREPNLHNLDVLRNAFPGGSITGAPKIRAMQIIESLEQQRRHIYCGSMAYLSSNGNMDSNIAIRTLATYRNRLYCWAGGGIVADSDGLDEYQESLDKIKAIKQTLDANLLHQPNTWLNNASDIPTTADSSARHWLIKPHVLSDAMARHCNHLKLDLLAMQFEPAHPDEALALQTIEPCLVRQVAFYGDDQVWTFARTVIPAKTYFAYQQAFDQLNEKPIGVSLLYNNDKVTRSPFEYSQQDLSAFDLCPFQQQGKALARRSIFYIDSHPLLISEYFCEQIPDYAPA